MTISPYTQADLHRRFDSVVKRGVIHSVQATPPRCRVTLGDNHATDWLMWFTIAGHERIDWNMPAIGDPAIVLSEGGDLRNGVVLAGVITDNMTPPSISPTEHVTQYSNGTRTAYDSSSNLLSITLAKGGQVKMIASAGLIFDGPVTITQTLNVEGNTSVKGNVTATGDLSDKAGSIQSVRDKYDGHDHEYSEGTTGKPNQSF